MGRFILEHHALVLIGGEWRQRLPNCRDVAAAEAVSVGDIQYTLPGIGSYVARAIQNRNLAAVGWAIVAMTITIVIYDQILFRPMVASADKFRFELTAASKVPRSWLLDLFRGSKLMQFAGRGIGTACSQSAKSTGRLICASKPSSKII